MKNKETKIEVSRSVETVLSGPEKRLQELINGAKPATPDEEKLVQQIEEALKNGKELWIPSN